MGNRRVGRQLFPYLDELDVLEPGPDQLATLSRNKPALGFMLSIRPIRLPFRLSSLAASAKVRDGSVPDGIQYAELPPSPLDLPAYGLVLNRELTWSSNSPNDCRLHVCLPLPAGDRNGDGARAQAPSGPLRPRAPHRSPRSRCLPGGRRLARRNRGRNIAVELVPFWL